MLKMSVLITFHVYLTRVDLIINKVTSWRFTSMIQLSWAHSLIVSFQNQSIQNHWLGHLPRSSKEL